MDSEFNEILSHGWDTFLRENNDPALNRLADVDHTSIFPAPAGSLPDRYDEVEDYENRYRAVVAMAADGLPEPAELPGYARGLKALETLRKELFEDWLAGNNLDGVLFHANADVGAATADIDKEAADKAWENGIFFSNGNYALRHFGIPSITVAMGTMADIGMPVGLTIAGPAYQDSKILSWGYAFEAEGTLRTSPRLAPPLASDNISRCSDIGGCAGGMSEIDIAIDSIRGTINDGARLVQFAGMIRACSDAAVVLDVNGERVPVLRDGTSWSASMVLQAAPGPKGIGSNPLSSGLAVILAVSPDEAAAGAFTEF